MPGANLSLLEGPRKSYSETTTGKIGTPISKATWKAPFSKDHVLHEQPKLHNQSPVLGSFYVTESEILTGWALELNYLY